MGYWQYKYESIEVGVVRINGEDARAYKMVEKKDRWIPNMMPDPILGTKGGWVWDPTDKEPK
jgi:hypothetical protein